MFRWFVWIKLLFLFTGVSVLSCQPICLPSCTYFLQSQIHLDTNTIHQQLSSVKQMLLISLFLAG